jgi:hypothetical protein
LTFALCQLPARLCERRPERPRINLKEQLTGLYKAALRRCLLDEITG